MFSVIICIIYQAARLTKSWTFVLVEGGNTVGEAMWILVSKVFSCIFKFLPVMHLHNNFLYGMQ